MKQLIGLALCSALSLPSFAQNFYAGLEGSYSQTDVGSASFNPVLATLRIGGYLEPQVGLELQASTGATDDSDLDIDAEINYSIGLTTRFESPPSDEGMKVYILLGYALTDLEMDRSKTGSPGSETFEGVTYGGGLEFPLGQLEQWSWQLQYQSFYSDDDLDISTGSLGIRFRF